MKAMPFNMNKFKKVHSDAEKTTLQHADGHSIIIAHKALSPKMRSQLEKLPLASTEGRHEVKTKPGAKAKAYAEGGNVKKTTTTGEALDPYGIGSATRGAVNTVEGAVRGQPKKMAEGGEVEENKKKKELPPTEEQGVLDPYGITRGVTEFFGGKTHPLPTPSPTPKPQKEHYAYGSPDMVSESNVLPTPMPQASEMDAPPTIPTNPTTSTDTKDADFQKRYDEIYNQQRLLNPGEPEQFSKSFAQEAAMRPIKAEAAQKQSSQDQLAQTYEHDKAYVEAQNKERAAAGISPLPLPTPPAGLTSPQPMGEQPITEQPPVGGAAPGRNPIAAGTEEMLKFKEMGQQQQMTGLQGLTEATIKEGDARRAALERGIGQEQMAMNSFNKHKAALDSEHAQFMKDYQNQHIDPNHFFSSMSTPGKIATAIGLIVGGFGAGMAGLKSNPAMDFLSQQIDRDIDAQKMEMGKTHNLLRANMEQYGNLFTATKMTQSMQASIIANQLEKAALSANTEKAKAQALMAAGKLNDAASQWRSQGAARLSILDQMHAGLADPAMVVSVLAPDQKAKDAALKEVDDMKHIMSVRDQVLSAFDDLSKAAASGIRHPLAYKNAKDKVGLLTGELSKMTAGRFSEMDAHMIQKVFPNLADFNNPELIKAKRDQMLQTMNGKVNFSQLPQYGIDPYKISKYDREGKSKYQESAPVTKKR